MEHIELGQLLPDRIVDTNVKLCPCCSQPRPYPTEPGVWEFCQAPYMPKQIWIRVEVKLPDINDRDGDEGLRLWRDDEMLWWPGNATWRKIE